MKLNFIKIKIHKKNIIIWIIILGLFLSGMIFLTQAIWNEYRNTIISQQEEQMLLISRSVASNMTSMMENYVLDLNIIADLSLFDNKEYTKAERLELIKDIIYQYIKDENQYVSNIKLINEEGEALLQVEPQNFKKVLYTTDYSDEVVLDIRQGYDKLIYMVLSRKTIRGYTLELVIDLKAYYKSMISSIKLGTNGYIMVKTMDGIIIMHPSDGQLGLEVIEGREEKYPGLDLAELEKMIEKQKLGQEGIAVYHSYWWTEKELPYVKKINAYSPAKFGNTFFIIGAVIDFDDIYVPVAEGILKIIIMLVLIFIGIMVLIIVIMRILKDKETVLREIVYLRELNATLEEMHRSEEKIAHQQRLQIMGTMTGGIAHEFNNLLTPIMGYAGLMLEDFPKNNAHFEDVKEIYEAAEKAKDIINQISSLSRKNMETTFKFIQAKKMIERSMKMVSSICPPNVQLKIKINFDQDGFLGNETQMNQVMLNLCVNAFYAIGHENGVLSVEGNIVNLEQIKNRHPSKNIELGNQNYIQIIVKDTGCGMDEATIREIFNPFFTTKQQGQGTGLGLSLVENFIIGHQGFITAESELLKGSTFFWYLPVSEPIDETKEYTEETYNLPNIKIMILDDNPKVLNMLQKGLEKLGIDFVLFQNIQGAIDELSKNKYNVLILDDSLPGMSGLTVASFAKNHQPNLKIILLIVELRKEIIEAKNKQIIDSYMEKPIICHSLLQQIRELLR